MQLNGKALKGIRTARTFWIAFLLLVFGLVFIGFGVYFFVTDQSKHFETATATITEIRSETIGEQETFSVVISFVDKNGVSHENIELNAFDSKWKVNDKIEIKYNVNNPEEVRTNNPNFVFPLISVSLGSIAVIVAIVCFVKTVKSAKRKPATISKTNTNKKESIQNTKFYFHYSGKMNQSHKIEDKNGNVVFECKLEKFNPFASSTYEFIDHKTGESKRLKIGKTVTSSSDGGLPFVGDILSSRFKIDGTNCWDLVASMGYEIRHLFGESKTVISYEVLKNKKLVAKIVPANTKDPFNEHSENFLRMAKGYYRLEIVDAILEDIVLIAFVITRTAIVE